MPLDIQNLLKKLSGESVETTPSEVSPSTNDVGESSIKLYGVIMCRNESTNISRSIDSLKGLDGLFVYDTGSTDNTIQVARDDCTRNNLSMWLLEGKFEDFSISRNKLLDFARDTLQGIVSDEVKDTKLVSIPMNKRWFILLDANDTLQGSTELRRHLETVVDGPTPTSNGVFITNDAIYIRQQWKTAVDHFLDFKNHRCVRADSTMRYTGVVHECLVESDTKNPKSRVNVMAPDAICVYQDRQLDTTQSSEARWSRDKKLLLKSYHKEKPKVPRTVFYLAQTCKCLGHFDEALRYYRERLDYPNGFEEERYVAAYEIGYVLYTHFLQKPFVEIPNEKPTNRYNRQQDYKIQQEKLLTECKLRLIEAFDWSHRAEPLIILGRHHLARKEWSQAYMYLHTACKVPEPVEALLWYDKRLYSYERWHYLSQAAFYFGEFAKDQECKVQGRIASEKAVAACNLDIDKNNLAIYKNLGI